MRSRRRPHSFLLLVLLGVEAHAATFVVDRTKTADAVDAAAGDGRCATSQGVCTLRAAVQEANALAGPDRIVLEPGRYLLTLQAANEDLSASGDLDVRDDVEILGAGPEATRIVQEASQRVLEVFAGTVTVAGVRIQGGRGQDGAGIRNRGAALRLERARITGNVAGATNGTSISQAVGGGIANDGGTLLVIDSIVDANASGEDGGGLYNADGAVAVVRRSRIADNRPVAASSFASGGGGLVNLAGGRLEIDDSSIDGNHLASSHVGGAGVRNAGELAARNVTISGNIASSGLGHTIPSPGGGIFNSGSAVLESVTIASNVDVRSVSCTPGRFGDCQCGTTGPGGGLVSTSASGTVPAATTVLRHSLVAGNTSNGAASGACTPLGVPPEASDCVGPVDAVANVLDVNRCGAPTASNAVSVQARRFDPLAANGGVGRTHALHADNPAIDAAGTPGGPGGCPPADQRGIGRTACDAGAYERATCGDGVLGAGEACDPAAPGAACCDPDCTVAGDGTPCEDGRFCTTADRCRSGACVAEPWTCGNDCNLGFCDEAGDTCDVQARPATTDCTDDGNACTDDRCDPQGFCAHPANAATCDDRDACTDGDRCSGGTCGGGARRQCPAPAACKRGGACDAATGACLYDDAEDATGCTDADPCTLRERCAGGVCGAGAILPCEDGNPCTTEECRSGIGCQTVAVDPQCEPCTTAGQCNDGNPCTTETCVGGRCARAANTALCDDGLVCTSGDQCTGGTCAGAPVVCPDDGNACTRAACEPATGRCRSVRLETATCAAGGCGDGVVDPGETCDSGGAPDTCCAPDCLSFKPAGTVCRQAGAVCRADALCDGTRDACPANGATVGVLCSDDDPCTVSDTCAPDQTCTPGERVCQVTADARRNGRRKPPAVRVVCTARDRGTCAATLYLADEAGARAAPVALSDPVTRRSNTRGRTVIRLRLNAEAKALLADRGTVHATVTARVNDEFLQQRRVVLTVLRTPRGR